MEEGQSLSIEERIKRAAVKRQELKRKREEEKESEHQKTTKLQIEHVVKLLEEDSFTDPYIACRDVNDAARSFLESRGVRFVPDMAMDTSCVEYLTWKLSIE